MTVNQDWDKIRLCFSAMRQFDQPLQSYGNPQNREEVVRLAAKLMKPRQNVARLIDQINFVCFE